MRRSLISSAFVVLSLAACNGGTPPADSPPAPSASASGTTTTTAQDVPSAAPSSTVATPPPAGPTAAWHTAGFMTPESVLYDPDGDRYFVSNINGGPLDADNNGFISEVGPDGKITKEKWVAGGANKVTLNAPKGMAIANGQLYVADIRFVRSFDLKSGAPKENFEVAGATFLNDVASTNGKIYVTDSGMKAGAKGDFEGTGTDAVIELDFSKPSGQRMKVLAKGKDLNRPNGVWAADKNIYVNTFASNEVFKLDDKGAKQEVTKTPKGGLDGLVWAGDWILVSSWEGSAVYKGKLGGTFEPAFTNLKAPADIGFDTKRKRVLVPLFMDNAVEAWELK